MNPIQPTQPEQAPQPISQPEVAGKPAPEQPAAPVPVESAPQLGSSAPPPVSPPLPQPAPIAGVPPTVPPPTSQPAAAPPATPLIADDVDVIEKEWVDHANKIIEATNQDPFVEEEAIEELQVDYLKKRYGKEVKKDQPPAASQ